MSKMLKYAAVSAFSVLIGGVAHACEARLARPTPTCPAVTYGPEDCDATPAGRRGDVFRPAVVHVMTNGHSYACAPHESCVELKDLEFRGCRFRFKARLKEESSEYASHFVVE